jgi:ABC-type Fe3+-hydroxamate transport system substrate-binding protein
MPCVTDDRGRILDLPTVPKRLVSLVPSSTETLVHLVGREAVVGVTRFCTRPRGWVKHQTKIGGTKDVSMTKVMKLSPDLVVGNAEENTREIFEALDPLVPVYVAFPRGVEDALSDLARLAVLVGAQERGLCWVSEIRSALATLRQAARPFRYAYLIWRDPWMSVSGDTFINAMLAEAGGINVFASARNRYPVVTAQDLVSANPDRVLLSSEPFPFTARHAAEITTATGWQDDRVRFVDGELCSWHGVRMVASFRWMQRCMVQGWPLSPTHLDEELPALP